MEDYKEIEKIDDLINRFKIMLKSENNVETINGYVKKRIVEINIEELNKNKVHVYELNH